MGTANNLRLREQEKGGMFKSIENSVKSIDFLRKELHYASHRLAMVGMWNVGVTHVTNE